MYDVVICGAGPAGACAGYEAAAAGLKTLILEKRDTAALQDLRRRRAADGRRMICRNLVPEAFVEATVTHLRHTWNFGDAHLAALNPDPNEPPMSLWMVQRSVFDNALTERAAQAGCDVRDGSGGEVGRAGRRNAGRVTTADGEVYTAAHMIGADGANGVVARWRSCARSGCWRLRWRPKSRMSGAGGTKRCGPKSAHLEYARQAGLCLGLSESRASVGRRGNVRAAYGRGPGRGEQSRAGPLDRRATWRHWACPPTPRRSSSTATRCRSGAGPSRSTAWNGRVLLAGDAAGLVNPLFGDGISYACRSGALAGKTIAAGQAAQWTETLRQEFGASHDAALTIAKFFYQFPGVCYQMGVKRPHGTRIAGRLIGGDLRFDSDPGPPALEKD